MRRTLSVVGIVVGVLLLLAAGVTRFVAAPALAVLPSDTDTTRTFEGTAAVLLNAQALSSPGSGEILLRDVPIEVQQRTQVVETDGGNALVDNSRTVQAADGTPVAAVEHRYAVDRSDMGRGDGFDDVVEQDGQTFGWPIRTEKKDYTGWVTDTQSTTPLRYTGTETVGGIETYVFEASMEPTLITDPQVLENLPPALPKGTLVGLAAGLGLPGDTLASLQQALPQLPDEVPLEYTFAVDATYYIAPDSGVVVDAQKREVRDVGIVAGPATIPAGPVLDLSFSANDATLAEAVDDAQDSGDSITLLYTTLPLLLLGLGALVLLLSVVGLAGARRQGGQTKTPPAGSAPYPTAPSTGTPARPAPDRPV